MERLKRARRETLFVGMWTDREEDALEDFEWTSRTMKSFQNQNSGKYFTLVSFQHVARLTWEVIVSSTAWYTGIPINGWENRACLSSPTKSTCMLFFHRNPTYLETALLFKIIEWIRTDILLF